MDEYTLDNLHEVFTKHCEKFSSDELPPLEASYNLPFILKIILSEIKNLKKQQHVDN